MINDLHTADTREETEHVLLSQGRMPEKMKSEVFTAKWTLF
jgi:hypothetical protein